MIEFESARKVFESGGDEVVALEGLDLRVEPGETVCLIGTSGSGKTTALRMVNRLEEPTSGAVRVKGENVADAEPISLRRGIGYVIQRGGLFPHMSVGRNIGLLCRMEGWEGNRIAERVSGLLKLVGLDPEKYADRLPSELSGGQQQRVSIARALAFDPDILLMDEPFGALDPITRNELHEEFLHLKKEVHKTTLLVTHDLPEAFKLGDRIALLHKGRLVQEGTREDLLDRPATEFVEHFVGSQLEDQ